MSSFARGCAWCLVIVAASANGAGYLLDLFQKLWWFDRAVHAGTIFAVTLWLAVFAVAPALRIQGKLVVLFIIASTGVTVGAVWEVVEWGTDQMVSGNLIKGKYDTILDLIMDMAGASAAAVASLALWRGD